MCPRSVSPNEAGERYTLSVHTVLIDPETKGHSRHQFQCSDCATGYTEIEVGVAVLECSDHRPILDARLNLSDGATVALWGLDQFDAVLIGADLGKRDGGVDGHGLFVVDSVILSAGRGRRGQKVPPPRLSIRWRWSPWRPTGQGASCSPWRLPQESDPLPLLAS